MGAEMRAGILLAVLLSLLGCASRQDLSQRDDEHCRSYGALPGSPAYMQCRAQQDDIHQRDREVSASSPAGMISNAIKGN
ncbi:MAG: hypothetical protein JWP25_3620 [Bradyrhizobium sp.]|nr:hypothetical protein [Bradyrhizobium sp.]